MVKTFITQKIFPKMARCLHGLGPEPCVQFPVPCLQCAVCALRTVSAMCVPSINCGTVCRACSALCVVMQSIKNTLIFFNKKKTKKHRPKKLFFMFFYYYSKFKGKKVFFNTLECLFVLYTSCKTLHSVCQLHFH